MELYILDDLLRRIQVIDKYESLIWTERFKIVGDFELSVVSNRENRSIFSEGTQLALNESYRVMEVDTIEDKLDEEGRQILNVKGVSIEGVMDHRLARGSMVDSATEPKWIVEGLPVAVAEKIFHDICVAGILDPGDVIPFIQTGSIFPASTLPAPEVTISYEIEPKSVYEALKDLCEQFNMGFRLVRNFDNSELYFDIYMGDDRTTKQTTYPAVVFSPDLENLSNVSELKTMTAYKNVAYVISPAGTEIVYEEGIDPTISGFKRRVLFVKADDIDDFDPAVATARMIQRGREELAKNKRFAAFDGEISQTSTYKYGVDYNLGDLVEVRNSDGVTNDMQVTEQIFVSDKEGERSYPTLALYRFIVPGTWLAWTANQVWADLGPTEYWENA